MIGELLDRSVDVDGWVDSKPSRRKVAVPVAGFLVLPATALYLARPDAVVGSTPVLVQEIYSLFDAFPLLPYLMFGLLAGGLLAVWEDVLRRTTFARVVCAVYVAACIVYSSLFLVTAGWFVVVLAAIVAVGAVGVGGVYGVGKRLLKGVRK